MVCPEERERKRDVLMCGNRDFMQLMIRYSKLLMKKRKYMNILMFIDFTIITKVDNLTIQKDVKEYHTDAPSFGNTQSSFDDVNKFYDYWKNFVSRKSFSWVNTYNLNTVRFLSFIIIYYSLLLFYYFDININFEGS